MCSQVFSDSSYSNVEGSVAMMNMGRSNPELGAFGNKRAQEVCSSSRVEQTSKRAKIPQGIYILLYTEGGPYCPDFIPEILGLYSSKTRAIQDAKVAFEKRSNGCYKNGGWREDMANHVDNTESIGDVGSVFLMRDMEGYWYRISLGKKQIDVTISP
jgi:hypothetical protein